MVDCSCVFVDNVGLFGRCRKSNSSVLLICILCFIYWRLMGFGLGLYLNQCLSHGLYHGSVTVRTSPVIACLHSIHSASVHFLFSVIPVINDSHTHSHTTLHTRLTHTLYFLVDCYFDLDFCFVVYQTQSFRR